MHVRVSVRKVGEKTYRYAQLVRSYRRPTDGLPAHQVVAHLGALSERELTNLRTALAASREGRRIVVAGVGNVAPVVEVLSNLSYLDVAVALKLWQAWQLDELVEQTLAANQRTVEDARVVTALVIQRCVSPGSKLYAQRWFPRTALPEMLGIAPGSFNNSRVHRVLDAIEAATPELQRRLSTLIAARRREAFAALFIDVTDTWFVGHGPQLAQSGKTKEGFVRRKVGIVLMCDADGLPLRWQLLEGRQQDAPAMMHELEALREVSWVGSTPVVCDRALGKTAYVRRLSEYGVRFLTALTVDEYPAYTQDAVPHAVLSQMAALDDNAVEQAASAVVEAGMSCVSPTQYVLDLGVKVRQDVAVVPSTARPVAAAVGDWARAALEQAEQLRADLDEARACSYSDVGRQHDLPKERVKKLLALLRLTSELRQRIRDGAAATMSLNALLRVAAHKDESTQRQAFEHEQRCARGLRTPRGGGPLKEMQRRREQRCEPLAVRVVVVFNPEQFVEERRGAEETLTQLMTFVRRLNEQSSTSRRPRSRESLWAEVDRELRRRSLLDAFEIVAHESHESMRVELQLRPDAWRRRRRYDGFSVLVAHPQSPQSAAELAQLYRAKDAVERDFHVIKSIVQLRPVRHRTDAKVRAHVTLCVLALLLQRAIELQLAAGRSEPSSGSHLTAAAVFELLSNVHLNRLQTEASDEPVYTVTRIDSDQRATLQALGCPELAQDDWIGEHITPR
jgi:hypothetical protein